MPFKLIKLSSALFIEDPAYRGQKGTQPGSRIRNTAGTNSKMAWLLDTDGKMRRSIAVPEFESVCGVGERGRIIKILVRIRRTNRVVNQTQSWPESKSKKSKVDPQIRRNKAMLV
jgi:hypothetical protein